MNSPRQQMLIFHAVAGGWLGIWKNGSKCCVVYKVSFKNEIHVAFYQEWKIKYKILKFLNPHHTVYKPHCIVESFFLTFNFRI